MIFKCPSRLEPLKLNGSAAHGAGGGGRGKARARMGRGGGGSGAQCGVRGVAEADLGNGERHTPEGLERY